MINKMRLISVGEGKVRFTYRVEKGERLIDIAERFDTSIEILISINGLIEEVSCGELIIVERGEGKKYFVKPWDTIESIAHNNEKEVFELVGKIKTDCVYVGQKIYI